MGQDCIEGIKFFKGMELSAQLQKWNIVADLIENFNLKFESNQDLKKILDEAKIALAKKSIGYFVLISRVAIKILKDGTGRRPCYEMIWSSFDSTSDESYSYCSFCKKIVFRINDFRLFQQRLKLDQNLFYEYDPKDEHYSSFINLIHQEKEKLPNAFSCFVSIEKNVGPPDIFYSLNNEKIIWKKI